MLPRPQRKAKRVAAWSGNALPRAEQPCPDVALVQTWRSECIGRLACVASRRANSSSVHATWRYADLPTAPSTSALAEETSTEPVLALSGAITPEVGAAHRVSAAAVTFHRSSAQTLSATRRLSLSAADKVCFAASEGLRTTGAPSSAPGLGPIGSQRHRHRTHQSGAR